MTDLRTAAQQALEAWEHINKYGFVLADYEGPMEQAITALKAALEQPEQEPVANNPDPYHLSRILHELAGSASMCWDHVDRAGVFQSTQAADVVAAAIAEIRQRMKDAPSRRREWRGLKEWEINDGLDQLPTKDLCNWSFRQGVYFAEAALKEKNHD